MNTDILLLSFFMGLVTYIPRWFPLAFLSRRRLPGWFTTWLDFIPVSILSALVAPALITSGEPRHMDILRPELFVAVPTFIIALKTRSLGLTVVAGMLLFWVAGMWLR
ncbi:MAG TPA: AzlD domain-containing protein [Syntrophales bacterium]|jgi:branched-subunit amino acid transport protein|nr:AzlD domain-containing protein [Syntrophales bacterium]HRT61744.1 AzlD domain-containing protein [Syntrophales bacterium]